MGTNLKRAVDRMKREVRVYQLVLEDRRVPRSAKWFLGLAVAYALSPIDLIPDFIPIVGHLDDVLIVPALLWLARRTIPGAILDEYRERVDREALL